MKEIELIDTKLIFRRKLWSEETLFLAQCLWFQHSEETNEIVCDLTVTLRTAVKSFLEEAFPALMNQPMRADEKNALSKDVAAVYKRLKAEYIRDISPRIPYWNVLRKHQKEVLISIRHRKSNLLAMQMRTGKSITAATHSNAMGCRRTVILTYSIGKFNFMNDLVSKRWNRDKTTFDQFDFTILDAAKRKCMYAWREKFVIVNYESAEKYLNYLIEGGGIKTDHIILDECQRCKNSQSGLSKTVSKLIDACPDARITLMSGTPVMNRIDDSWNFLRLVKHPLGKSKAEFDRRYLVRSTQGQHTKTIGAKDTDKLAAHMSNFVTRVLFSDCSDMPPKLHLELVYNIGEWRDKYQEAVRKAIEDHGKRVSSSWIHSVNNVMAQAKVSGTVEQCLQIVDGGDKVVVFTSYEEPLNMLEKAFKEEGVKYVRVDGNVIDAHDKLKLSEQFQNDDETMIFIGNIAACGHTVRLDKANIVIMLNQPLTPKANEQAMARLEHMDKKDVITIYYATAIGEPSEVTVDMKLSELNLGKLLDIDAVMDGGKDINNISSMSELLFESMINQYQKTETA